MRKLYLFCLTLTLAVGGIKAQINKICFTAAPGTFTQLSGSVAVNGIEEDDNNVQNIPLGFTFNYLGNNFTQASASSNGWLSFTNASPSDANSRTNNIATTTAGLVNTLYPLWDDLDGASAIASYLTTGAAGSRVFTMEWRNWQWNYNSSAAISFQVKLYEGTNIIEYVYRQEAGAVNTTGSGYTPGASIGLTDAIGGATHYLSLNNSGTNPVASSTVATNNILTKPATGQIYRFTPSALPAVTGLNPNPVCGAGSAVTISGSNFNPCLSAVTFNGTAATVFTYVNATTVTATVPAGATSGPVSVTTPGGTATSTTSLIISSNGAITLSSGAGSPTICINNPLTNIAYSIGGSATGAVLSGSLPAGVNGSFTGGIFSINGTPSVSGTFNYTVTTTGSSCTNSSLSGTITVNANAGITLSSPAGSDAQVKCINTAISDITYTITGSGTGASVTGLPGGVNGTFNAGIFTISGIPAVAGNFNYTVSTTGPCIKPSISGTITVTANGNIALTSGTGTNTQTICFPAPVTDITYNIGGTSTGASITAGSLPPGVTGAFNAGIFTISGAPTAAGIYSYTIGTSGSSCLNPTASGTITVYENATISLSSAAGTNVQSLCALTPITNISYSIGGAGTTGAIVSGLPSGITGSYNSGTFIISGSTATTGTFNFTVNTTGSCINASSSGTIIVNANGTVTLSSAAGTDAQQLCLNGSFTNITYNIGADATGAAITSGSLPAGITGSFSSGVFTISGTPTASGAFSYTVGASGSSCANLTASGIITVNENATISLSSAAGTNAQTTCINNAIINISYAIGGFGTTGAIVSGLPAGVTGSYSTGIFTISGTPNVPGTFNYTVTTTGPCINSGASGSIIVQANSSITLSSGTASQTKCINNPLTSVSYTIAGGATGASISAGSLPAGVTGLLSGNVFTISGTPAASGTYPYTITTSGPCVNNSLSGTITVNADATISLASATGTNVQTRCVNNAITNITYAIGGSGTTGAIVSGLPAGVTGSYSSGLFTISGTPDVSGTFNYTVTTSGPCINSGASGSITVQANSTISLSSGTASQTKCINTSLTPVAYTIGGGATGASVTAGSLPAGVTGVLSGNVFTISGTPEVSGIFPYTITTSGPCLNNSLSGTITINADATISLSSATGTNVQTRCINSAIANITYAIGGFGTTGAAVSGLPAGVNGTYASGVFTISGTPSIAGTFNYTVSTTGPCFKPTAGGSITVQANSTITRTSASSTTSQTICINNAITNITYAIAGGGTGATVTGLPAGINGSFSGGVFTISGISTISGNFSYAVTATGPCVNPSLGGTINVNADATISLTSATSTTAQVKCINTSITNITYLIGGGGTGAGVTGLPAGVTGSYNSGTKVYTISGSPSVAGTFNYTVTSAGPCIKPSLAGTITVTPNATISLSSASGTNVQTICTFAAITNITYAIGGSGNGATITGLPPGVTGNYNAGVYTISGSPTAPGTYSYVVATTGPCVNPSLSGTLTVNNIPSGNLTATEASVNANDNIICTGSNVKFTATAGFGSYIFKVNGSTVQSGVSNILNTATLANGASVTVDVANGLNCGATFGPVIITVNQLPSPVLSSDKTSICPGDNVIFTAGGGTLYTFNVNGASVQSGSSNTYSSTSLSNGNAVTVEVTNGNGCKATSAPIVVTVNTLPSGTLNATATSICTGDNIIFTATGGFSNYNFKVNGTSVQNNSSNVFSSASLTNPSVVTVEVTNSSGCKATFSPVVITVSALPAGTLTATENSGISNDNSICGGDNVTFTASSGFTGYDFRVNGISIQNSASNVYNSTSLLDNDVVTVVITNGSNCTATLNSIAIDVLPLPTGSLAASISTICSGDNIDFIATAGFVNYDFKINGITVQNGGNNTYNTTGLNNNDVVTVDVTNAGTCSATFNSILITVSATPSGILAISENSGTTPNDGIICTGANVLFTAPAGFSNYNFLLNGISVQSSASNAYINSSLATANQVTVAVTNANNCIGLLNTWSITVNTLPAVSSITGSLNVCVDSTTALSNATSGGVWSSSNTGIASVDASGIVTGLSGGAANIFYTVTNINGCSASSSASVTVMPLPAVMPVSGLMNICVSNTTVLSSATPGGIWSSSNTAVATVNNAGLVSGISGGTAIISYTVANANGCTKIATALVTVNSLPVLDAISGALNICVNTTSQLANSTDGGIWSSNNTAVATVNSSTGLVSGISPGTAVISYVVTDGNNCSSTVTALIIINALPVPTLSGPNPICPNSTGTYTTEAGQLNYTWTFTGGTLVSGGSSSDNMVTIFWDQPGTKTIYVNYTNAEGCFGATSATVTTSTGTVPTLGGPVSACLNSDGIYATDAAQSGYSWAVAEGTITAGGTSTDNTATITWNTPGSGSVSINFTDVNGCTGIVPTVLPVMVRPLPAAIINGTTSVCLNSSAPFITFTGTGGTAPYTFTYNINGGTNQTITTVSGNSAIVSVSTGTAGTFIYNLLSVSDNNSCLQIQAGSATVTVKALPTATVSGSIAACQNSASPDITFTGTAGIAPFTFLYNINGGTTQSVSTTLGNSVTISAPTSVSGSFVYNLLNVSDANSCSQMQNGSATVTVNPSPLATINGTASVCQNSAAPAITFTGTGGTAPYIFTYNINGGGNLIITSVGNTVNLPVPTSIPGAFIYNLVSVQDASVAQCSQVQTGLAIITVTPVTQAGTVGSNATVCAATNNGTLILSGYTGSILRWELSTDGGAVWTPVSNTTNSLTYTNLLITTQYRAVVQSGACPAANSTIATITVNQQSAGGAVTNNATVCSGINNGTLTLAGHNGSVTKWEFSINGGSTWTTIANTTTSQAYTNLTQTTIYRAIVSNGVCASMNSAPANITVNPLPTATVSGTTSVCLNAPSPVITFTGAIGTAPYTFTYKINAGANLTVTSTGNTATVTAPTSVAGTFTYTLVSVKDAASTMCTQNQSGSATVTVNSLPNAFIITPASVSMCQGNVQPLSASASVASNGSLTFSSGTVNLAIPEGNRASTIAVSGIPAGAVITGASVNFNITHGYDDDLVINLRAPNNNTLNLVNERGGSGDNFTNTIISSSSANPVNSGASPFANTYSADAVNNVGTPNSNVTAFTSLYSTPNGNWILNVEDVVGCHGNFLECLFGGGSYYTGVLNSWSVTINYTIPNSPLNVIWTPSTNLYTDPGGITAYAGQALSTVYVKPANAGTIVYTATTTNAAGCTGSKTVSVTASPKPVVTITADYCTVPNKVRLTASSVPVATSYIWSNGATTSFIDVDVAGSFDVTVFAGGGCAGTASINVAQELVANGDFEAGNTGFITPPLGGNQYQYVADGAATNELNPEGLYGVGPDAHTYHNGFWGHDHTTGTGNFMIINGFPNGNPQPIVWQQTVSVLPNTAYYFSAWGISVNAAGPFAQLQFNVNGAQVGTIATLPAGVNNNSNNGWTRFYGTLTTGPTTTSAIISITDLQNAAGGNDFGLDDISFATLSTFITLESAPGTDAQSICVNTPLTNIVYNVGNGSPTGPIVAGLPAGVTSVFSGEQVTISGTPTIPGTYTYTLTTTGTCLATTASGTITVKGQTIALSSGSSSPTVCINTPVNIGYSIGGTATGANTTGLPAGVTATLTGNSYVISGTSTVAGSYPYAITTTGTCAPVTMNGIITVQSQTIALNSGNASQTICINTALSNIQYTVGGTGSGVTVTGLPAGVTYSYNSGIVFITGTPTLSGVFNYTINTSGNCASVSAGGTINVTPNATLILTSGSGTNVQTVCRNTTINNMAWSVNNATGATISGLPAGVTGTYSGGIFTISGTPSVAGTFNYTITATGGCGSGTANGTLTVQAQAITLSSGSNSPSVCVNAAMTSIVYTMSGAAAGAVVTGLPAGISFSVSGNTLTISGTATIAGSYPYTITTSGACAAVNLNGIITVQPGANGGSLPSVSICSNNSGTLTLTGHTGSIVRWEYSTDGVTWIPISNTTISQSYANVTVPTNYRAVINNGCGSVHSPVAVVGIHNYWTGTTNTDWNTASNWADNQVPSLTCANVFIPGGRPNQPTLGSGTAAVQNIYIYAGAILTVENATMQIGGSINNSGTFIAANGTIEMNGTGAQTIPANTFMNNALKNLVINNSNSGGVTLAGSLDIYEALTYLGTGRNLYTGGFLTIKSTLSGTARVGIMTGNTITGNVTVERYIPNHSKAWQFLAVPTSGQSVNSSWQEGNAPLGNTKPGHGTIITSNNAGAVGLGFDIYTPTGPTMKTYEPLADNWTGIASPSISVANKKGYMLFVRGDRSVTAFNQAATPTVLRTSGKLYTTGADAPPSSTVLAGKLESVGNPYASAINFTQVTRSAGVDAKFYVWDPLLTNTYYGLGGYQTISSVNGWKPVPGGTANYDADVAYPVIQSGQAFFVFSTTGGGTVSFTEPAKVTGSSMIFRPSGELAGSIADRQFFGLSLYNGTTATAALSDGNVVAFDADLSNNIDADDAVKILNTGENIGISRGGKNLSVEARGRVVLEDTIFYNIGNLRGHPYRLRFRPENMGAAAMTAYLVDRFTNVTTELSLLTTTSVDFNVTAEAGSYAADRFYVVFRPVVIVPVLITHISATRSGNLIRVNWKVENETGIQQYEVERSADGRRFQTLGITGARLNNGGSASYSDVDEEPLGGDNFYRIKALNRSGEMVYSAIVKVTGEISSDQKSIVVYPNPVTGKRMNVRFVGCPAGEYRLELSNKLGQVVYSNTVQVSGRDMTGTVQPGTISTGNYQLRITGSDKKSSVQQVIIE